MATILQIILTDSQYQSLDTVHMTLLTLTFLPLILPTQLPIKHNTLKTKEKKKKKKLIIKPYIVLFHTKKLPPEVYLLTGEGAFANKHPLCTGHPPFLLLAD